MNKKVSEATVFDVLTSMSTGGAAMAEADDTLDIVGWLRVAQGPEIR
jgi:hypothetical protein